MRLICFVWFWAGLPLVTFSQDHSLITPGELLMLIQNEGLDFEMVRWQHQYEDSTVRRPLSRDDVFLQKSGDSITLRKASVHPLITKYHHLADQNLTSKFYKKAARNYQEAYKQDTANFNFLTMIGLCLDLEGRIDEAMEVYKKVIQLNPIDFRAYWRMGMIYYAQDDFDHAFAPILRAHLLNRNNISIEHYLDRVLALKKLRYKIWDFVPRNKIVQLEGNQMRVATDSCWYAYAQAKSFLYYKRLQPKSEFSSMTLQDEEELSLKVLFNYLEIGDDPCDESLQALEKAVSKGYLSEYVTYEILLPRNPESAFFFSEKKLNRLAEYVSEVRVVERK
jgi:tetratricopeptide (TPR) repeat protein